MGEFFLGIRPPALRASDAERWWERDDLEARHPAAAIPMVLGQQQEMFDDAGQVTVPWAERPAPPAAEKPVESVARPTVVSVRAKSRATGRVVATTQAAARTRVAAIASAPSRTHHAMARQLVLSQSISSGREEARWFSVPQRALLPRYQLYEGAVGVMETRRGLVIAPPATRAQRGRAWFV